MYEVYQVSINVIEGTIDMGSTHRIFKGIIKYVGVDLVYLSYILVLEKYSL